MTAGPARIATVGAAYFAAAFAAGFALGTLRVLWLEPRLGATASVAAELPLMLAISWFAAGAVLRRWPVPEVRGRIAAGALALALLLFAEATLVAGLQGESLADWAAGLASPPGALGLAGQIVFAVFPALRRPAAG
jgi:hypothetical protein